MIAAESSFRESSSKLRLGVDAGLLRQLGDATTAIFLLRDHEKFGLTERVCYHFDLSEALDDANIDNNSEAVEASEAETTSQSQSDARSSLSFPVTCGVSTLLECTPATPWHRLSKRQKRALKFQLRAFNDTAEAVRTSHASASTTNDILCYQPNQLPLQLNPSTRVFFAYEVTRIAFCVDASPSMTSTFGVNGSSGLSTSAAFGGPCCPLDRLPEMARTFFTSLVEPVPAASLSGAGIWRPILAVTVLAVFPLGQKAETSMLVRDYRVDSVEAAQVLADQIKKWIHAEVEVGISERLNRRHTFRTWSMPLYSSSLRDILEAGDYALSVLSSEARPIIVVATDGRSVSCDGVVDVFLDVDRVDIPVIILDVSLPETHVSLAGEGEIDAPSSGANKTEWNFLTYDPGGPADFPLHLSDDTEALYGICRATGGYFMDSTLLAERAKYGSGQQLAPETPTPYHFSYRRRFVKMNGIQWLTLFSSSPLSPTFHSTAGKLAPPQYLQKHLSLGMADPSAPAIGDPLNFSRHDTFVRQPTDIVRRSGALDAAPAPNSKKSNHSQIRMTFSTYFVSPVRIKALLVMRIKEGYRAKQYGMSTKDADKVFIQFTLPLELGTALHYEVSYKALSGQSHVVGSAHIKIELSGDPAFVQMVKNDFLRQGPEVRPYTMAQKVSARLCQVMRWIRREDILQSYLSPPSGWTDQLASPDSPFARRLGTMTTVQRRRHFRSDEFDVICTGQLPYTLEEDDFLSEFASTDNGEQELLELVGDWSTQVINKEECRYAKATLSPDGTTLYFLIEVRRSQIAPRLFTITLEFFGGTDPRERLLLLANLKAEIEKQKDVEVLEKQMGPFLVGTSHSRTSKKMNVEFQYHHARWDLVKDPELLPLVMKRRTEIGRFRLMQSNESSAIFAKVVPEKVHDVPGDLIQYQIAILPDKVVVNLHMESECGLFFPFGLSGRETKRFNGMVHVLRRRDQECGRALRSRTNLLKVLHQKPLDDQIESNAVEEPHKKSLERMLQYSSSVRRKIRFFHPSAGAANAVLFQIIESLLLSGSLGVSAAKLAILPGELIRDQDEGAWFVVQFDRYTMSIIHLSMVDRSDEAEDSEGQTYRNLTFFTSGISDLYSKRDDTNDDDSVDSHISEYMCVTEFADLFEVVEKENFAAAAYLALRNDFSAIDHFEKDDLRVVQHSLNFVEVADVLVAGNGLHSEGNTGDSKLTRLVLTILSPVPGDEECLFYSGTELPDDTFSLSDEDSESDGEDISIGESDEGELPTAQGEYLQRPSSNDEDNTSEDGNTDSLSPTMAVPIFVRFKLNGVAIPFKSLNKIEKSATLVAEVSVLKNDRIQLASARGMDDLKLPWSHQAVAAELNVLLKWYVAEQTIERLRQQGLEISQDDLKLVKKCMKRVQSTLTLSIDVFFYVSKSDVMVPASAPAGGESQVEEGFALLREELNKNEAFQFNPVASGGYFVSIPKIDNALPFWCFLYFQANAGQISSQIYHPDGEQVAVEVMNKIHDSIRRCIHLVNQQLLLKSLHRNRTASSLLIPSKKKRISIETEPQQKGEIDIQESFPPGSFACPIVFRTLFELFHRCATNPSQVARTLEATVLHSFAVSNRSGIFVYKDEAGGIFYMSLEARGSGIDGDGQVELLVHGIERPGPSVTEQLKVLLQRRLLLIGSDQLSSVLTKNPHFRIGANDLDFLRSFDHEWTSLANDNAPLDPREAYYEFPNIVTDPCMVLLMFRQNLCGSTFFHRLNDIGYERLSPSVTESRRLESGGSLLKWNEHDFTLYYNNAPSKLDQGFQGVSTLTEKGASLSRQVGSGIAMIEILLVRADGIPVDEIAFAEPVAASFDAADTDTSMLRFQRLSSFPKTSSNVCVRVRVTDTALSRRHLHQWIELTLNQSLVAWVIERGIERSSIALPYLRLGSDSQPQIVSAKDSSRGNSSEDLCPGLPSLQHLLETSHDLPHPGITRVASHGVIRSSTVSTKTLEMLETCIFGTIFRDLSTLDEAANKAWSNLRVIRTSRSSPPELVKLSWDPPRRFAVVHGSRSAPYDRPVHDSPIDCPEYICFLQMSKFGDGHQLVDPHIQLSREVMIHDGISDRSNSIELLESLKAQNRRRFMRSFAFVFSVKRNRRTLLTYNWTPSLVKSVSARLSDMEHSFLEEVGRSSHALQFRSLRILSPPTKVKEPMSENQKRSTPKPVETSNQVSSKRSGLPPERQEAPSESLPTRRIRRPVMIRRPKLVGKSVDGAALQAVAASRKRASSNQFKNAATPARRSSALPTLKEGGRAGSTTASSSSIVELGPKRLGRPPSALRRQKNREDDDDEDLTCIINDFQFAYLQKYWALRRQSALQSDSILLLSNIWWPRKRTRTVPMSVAEFMISKSPLAWNDICRFPPFPNGLAESFVPIFARWIAAFAPGVDLLGTTVSVVGSKTNSIFLSSGMKNVRGRKCFAVVKISKSSDKKSEPFVRCQGWISVVTRRPRRDQLTKTNANVTSASLLEKDSAGLDKLSSDVHRSLVLESLLFDFSASMIERAVRLLDERIDSNDLIPTLRGLMARYSLEQQKRIPMLNYRVFEAHVVLKSFKNKMIDKFDSVALLHGLHVEAEERDLIRCGAGLCFKRGISVKGSHSVCFLTPDPAETARMRLIILCRTQGRNLSDYMFREGSNVAVHILDNIVCEAAGLVYKELSSVAEKLHKEAIWKSMSTRGSRPRKTLEHVEEMLELCSVRPVLQSLGSNQSNGAADIIETLLRTETGIDWKSCCRCMKKERSFGASWSFSGESLETHLFYMEPCGTFLLLLLDSNGILQRADIIEKEGGLPSSYRQMTTQIFANFLLHFLWQTL